MIRYEPTKKGDKVKVTFVAPENSPEGVVAVVGDFNDWDPTATPLHKQGNQRRAALMVPSGRRYAFRYLGQDGRWFNDDAADDYEANDYGGQNGVIDLVQAR